MKKILFAFKIESILLVYDFVKFIKKQLWSIKNFKKLIIHILTIVSFPVGFWVAFQIIKGFTGR